MTYGSVRARWLHFAVGKEPCKSALCNLKSPIKEPYIIKLSETDVCQCLCAQVAICRWKRAVQISPVPLQKPWKRALYNKTKRYLCMAVFVRAGCNLPLEKCGLCHGVLPALDKSHFRVHVRCESAAQVIQSWHLYE